MSEAPPLNHAPLSIEAGVNVLLRNAQHSLRQNYRACEQHIRKSPTSLVLSALVVGYCATRLPLRAIAVAQVRVFAALAPPALFLFGAVKVYEHLQSQSSARNARLHSKTIIL
jgi:hypothetical protein